MKRHRNKNTDKSRIRSLLKIAAIQKTSFTLAMVFCVLTATITLVQPWYIRVFFSRGSFVIPSYPKVAGLIALLLSAGLFSGIQNYFLQRTGENIVRDMRKQLGQHLLNLPVSEYDHRDNGDLLSRFNSDTTRLRTALLQGSSAVASGVIIVTGAVISMLFIDPLLFSLAAILFIIVIALAGTSSKFVEKTSLTAQEKLGHLTSVFSRDLNGVRTIRATNAVEQEVKHINSLIDSTWAAGIHMVKVQSIISPLTSIGFQVSACIVLGLGMLQTTRGGLELDSLAQFVMLLFIIITPLGQLSYSLSLFGDSFAALTRIEEILSIPKETADEATPKMATSLSEKATTTAVPDYKGPKVLFDDTKLRPPSAVEFSNVSFSYAAVAYCKEGKKSKTSSVLDSLNLSVPIGRKIALVGPSGGGKTTILQLIERFYKPEQGEILVFGKNIESYSRFNLRKQITYVEQNAPTLSGTLKDNLLLGSKGISDDQCYDILKKVNLGHLLHRNGKGLDLEIGEEGVTLSGGEKQRLAVARSLISPAPIVLLDEATSSLDSNNELLISSLINNSQDNRTVIVVAHRLSTVVDADQINLIDHGKIIAKGTHAELIRTQPLYKKMATEQRLI